MSHVFCYPDGSQCNRKEFLEFYSKEYYMKNSKYVEDSVVRIIHEMDTPNKDDIIKVMAWKAGKINHKKSYEVIKYRSAYLDKERIRPAMKSQG